MQFNRICMYICAFYSLVLSFYRVCIAMLISKKENKKRQQSVKLFQWSREE